LRGSSQLKAASAWLNLATPMTLRVGAKRHRLGDAAGGDEVADLVVAGGQEGGAEALRASFA
jgi:hypothetical protein